MDQLRQIVAWLKKYHFWVLTLLIVAVAIGCWFTAAGTLREGFSRNQSTIQSQFSALSGVQTKEFLPNEEVNREQEREIRAQAASVREIWEDLYERQRENVLKWPAALPQEFRDYVENLKFGDTIRATLRDHYLNYVERHFEELPKIIGAREIPVDQSGLGGGYGRVGGGRERLDRSTYGRGETTYPSLTGELDEGEGDYICEWLDQMAVREKLHFTQRPSSLRIWVTQEDLWVYHTLLQIIANTNEAAGADRMSNAAVRVIQSLEVGQLAAQHSRGTGRIHFEQPQAAPGEFLEGGFGREAGPPIGDDFGRGGFEMMDPRGGMPGEGSLAEMEKMELLYGRYLGDDEKPVTAVPETIGPNSFGTGYKRLPVRMVLEMDVRWLPQLLVECGNQPLQVEVKEVRVNPADGGMGGLGGGRESFGRGGYSGGRGYGGRESLGGGIFDSTGRAGAIEVFDSRPHIATVVVQGIIYIFNEPDPAALDVAGQESIAGL